MSMPGDPWGDIDRTKSGSAYIVDESGWGWMALAILACLPLVYMCIALRSAAVFIVSHLFLVIGVFILLTIGIGALAYKNKMGKWTPTGMIATTFTFIPFMIMEVLVEIPSIINAGTDIGAMFSLLIEWITITIFFLGIGILIIALSFIWLSPIKHLIVSAVYCVITVMIVSRVLTPEKIDAVKMIYGFAQ